jgi:CENP-B N-terminal DNA-binding domain
MVFMMVHCVQRYKCLNCNRYFIKQEDRKRKSLTDDEKHIIDRLVDENISYRAIARVLNRALSTIQNYVC